jgi:HTH-type transcriptional regulator, sugar sensing transcriptional regulator
MELEDSISALINLGWSEYESKVYAALINEGKSTASQIAKVSKVPQNRVYQILDKLSDKGYVNRIQGKGSPAIFIGKEPQKVLAQVKEEHDFKVDSALKQLDLLQERSRVDSLPVSYTISGRREMNAQLNEIIKSAKEEISLVFDTIVEINLGNIAREINYAYSQGLNIRILTPQKGINDSYEKEALKRIKKELVKVSQENFANVIAIVDKTRVLFATYSRVSEETEEKNFLGIYIEDSNLAIMFNNIFENSWNNANNIEKFLTNTD